jgi:hypothetical protein
MAIHLNSKTIISCLMLSSVLVLSVSCKKMETSRLQSLDNFAAGKRVQTNVCAGNPALSNDAGLQQLLQEVERRIVDQDSNAETKSKNRKAVRDAFSALPPFAQSQFLALGGQVLLSKDANKLCTASVVERGQRLKRSDDELKLLREGYADVKACFVLANPAELEATGIASKSQLHMIIIANQPAEVSHNFVRVFGYMNAQLSARMAVQGDFISRDTQAVLTADYSQKFEASRRQIAQAFLDDLKGRPESARFAKFANMKSTSPGRVMFEEFVYAEAFDSYFCNQYASGNLNTFKVMARDYPKTLEAFSKNLARASQGFALDSSSSYSSWNPFGWVSNTYSSYVEKRDRMIDGMMTDYMQTSGGKAPGVMDTVSIAANAAWRPAVDVPVIDTVLKPAIKYADAYGGASINNSGRGELLTNSQRMRLAASGTADIGLNIAGGMVADAAGKKIGTYGAQKFADIAFETGAGRRIVHEVIETAPAVGKTVLKYGDQAVNYVVGGAGKTIVDNYIVTPSGSFISDTIKGE